MKKKKPIEKGIHALYAENPGEADRLLWGRETDPLTRRGFLKKSGLMAMAGALGAYIPFAENMPGGLIPAALAQSDQPFRLPGKHPGLTVFNDRPLSVETPAHLLDDSVTPADKLFIRDNGIPPQKIDPAAWTLTVEGESAQVAKSFTLEKLKRRFKHYTYQLTIECAGNGRSEFNPPTEGIQWTVGAVGCPEWTGVRLRDVLEAVGIKKDAVYIGFYGRDTHLSGEAGKVPISRGVPMGKALENESIIAFAMNGQEIPYQNGYPLRLVFGGWPGSVSGKWLERIVVRNKVHDGPKMTGQAYKVPCSPMAPGAEVAAEEMCIIESMPVKSLITFPESGAIIQAGQKLSVRGHAWAGDLTVSTVDVSIDFGASWQRCDLKPPRNRLAWQRWSGEIAFPGKGYYEVWVRARDSSGKMQPMVVPGWNPKGYLNNACHRIAVKVV